MQSNTLQKPLTHLELFRKYGSGRLIPNEELRAARAYITPEKNGLKLFFEAAREYEREVAAEAKATGKRPAVCFDREGTCEDDHCRCWK